MLNFTILCRYYIIKSIIISSKAKSVYEKQESDIKEITKKENKNIDFLDEEVEDDEEKNKYIEHKEDKTPKKKICK